MKSVITKQEDGTIKLDITIPASGVAKAKAAIVDDYVQNASLPGFRKGKAPKKLVEENIDDAKLNEEALRKLLPEFYLEAIKENKLNPVISPKIKVESLEKGKDWKFSAETCEAPEINLGNYKDNIKNLTAKSKIALPGKEPQPVPFDQIVTELLKSVKIKIPKIITDQEVDRLLAQTLDEIKRLGLTLEQYLASTGKSAEELRKDYATRAENDIKLEFSLEKIAQDEKLTVGEKEIEEAINKAPNEAEKKNLESNRYLLASILRQQKTLDYLRNL
jgi:FKBP-type peptidyl-prolyl cis-trans isomerase (trigger factor)